MHPVRLTPPRPHGAFGRVVPPVLSLLPPLLPPLPVLLLAVAALALGPAACGGPGDRGRGGGGDSAAGSTGRAAADARSTTDQRRTVSLPASVMNYQLTDDRYRRWVAAQRVLDTLSGLPAPPRFDTWHVTDAEIDHAVAFLESQPRARRAIEGVGMGVRDYVLTTVALDQALFVSSGRAGAPTDAVPAPNAALVARHRADLAASFRAMRFRVSRSDGDSVGAVTGADGTTSSESGAPPPGAVGAIRPGATLDLRSDGRVCTDTHQVGDRVLATVGAPVAGTNGTAIPAGAKARLTITRLEGSAGGHTLMEFTANSIVFGGTTYPVQAAVTSAQVEPSDQAPGDDDSAAAARPQPVECVPAGGAIRITLQQPVWIAH